jgi:hypothetical protein
MLVAVAPRVSLQLSRSMLVERGQEQARIVDTRQRFECHNKGSAKSASDEGEGSRLSSRRIPLLDPAKYQIRPPEGEMN